MRKWGTWSATGFVFLAGCGGADIGRGQDFGAPNPSVSMTNGSFTAHSLSSAEDNSPECSTVRGYTAGLAKATIDCLGTVGPFLYGVNEKGLLERRFDSCLTGGSNSLGSPGLLRIDRLLSLQLRQATLPNVLRCIPEAYDRAQRAFVQQGNSTCPMWKHQAAKGLATHDSIRDIAARLPPISALKPDESTPLPESFHFYSVAFAKETPDQPCGSAESCAQACSTVFPGFYVGASEKQLIGDPYEWLDPTVYDDWASNDPYRVLGYYHPMSMAPGRNGLPGPIYGDFARAKFPEDVDPSGVVVGQPNPDREAELCTRWDGTDHRMGRMVQDRLFPDQPDTWLSVCEFWPTTLGEPFAYVFPP